MRFCLTLLCLATAASMAAPSIQKTKFATRDLVVAEDVFAPTEGDCAPQLQKAIDQLAEAGGGTIFLPVGTYHLKSPILLKDGVVLRGDNHERQDLCENFPEIGTVFSIEFGANSTDGTPAFTLESGTGLRELVFWYPEQTADKPIPFPWTVAVVNARNADNQSIFNCRFVNSYQAIAIGPKFNELHTIRNTAITPFKTGIEIDSCTDIGRLDHVNLSADAFKCTKLPHKANTANLDGATGVIIRRSDWEYIRNITIDGLDTGFLFCKGVRGTTNAVMANSNITNCKTALKLQELNGIGLAIYNTSFAATQFPVHATPLFATNVQFNLCSFIALGNNAEILNEGTGILSFRNSSVNVTKATITNGNMQFSNCSSKANSFTIIADKEARGANIIGGQLATIAKIQNNTTAATFVTPLPKNIQDVTPELPTFTPKRLFPDFKPENLVLVTDFGASPTLTDNAPAFQKALDHAKTIAPATVYVPAGWYHFNSNINVPPNVELRGIFDVPHHTASSGSVLMINHNHGDEDADPFLTLSQNSGLRGLTFWYPNQPLENPVPYPWTIQGKGKNCWLVDTTVGNAWQFVDFASYDTTGHCINYLAGGLLRRGLFIANSTQGDIVDIQFNPHYAVRLPRNFPLKVQNSSGAHGTHIDFQRANLEAISFDNVTGETMLGTFLYGARDGIAFYNHCDIDILMHGTDTAWHAVKLECDKNSVLDFALAQLVPLGKKNIASIVTGSKFAGKATFVASQFWAGNNTAVLDGPGTVTLDQFNTLTGPVVVNNGTCTIAGAEFGRPLDAHIITGPNAKSVSIHAVTSRNNALFTNFHNPNQVAMFANAATNVNYTPTQGRSANLSANADSPATATFLPNNIIKAPGNIRDCADVSCEIVQRDDAHSGKHVFRLKGRSTNPSYSYVYCTIFSEKFLVTPDTVVSYWIKPLTKLGSHSGLDIAFENFSPMRDLGIADTRGIRQHTGTPKGPVGQWSNVVVNLGQTKAVGQTINRIMLAYDTRNADSEVFEVLFDDIEITSPLPQEIWSEKPIYNNGQVVIPNSTNSTIKYTLDGKNPESKDETYTKPIDIKEYPTELRYAFFDKDNKRLPFVFSHIITQP